jgi:CDP-diacylglycerol--glycerol-3-phosphate 3-phosphatidyltransferase
MISVYQIKPAFQKLLQPLLRAFHKLGVTANQLTIAAILWSMGLGALLLLYPEPRYVLLILAFGLLIRMALNALDGMMARQFQMQSRLGEILNEIGDVISDLVIIFPLMVLPGLDAWVVVTFGVLAVINEFAGLLGRALGGERRYDGPMGKSDRALLIGLFCLIYFFWADLAVYANWVFGLGVVLMVVSTFIRLKKALA